MESILPLKIEWKHRNHAEILRFLRENGPKPRIEIAAHMRLTKAAVTLIINEMLLEGILLECGEAPPKDQSHPRGRRKILVDVNENWKLVFGAVVEQDFIWMGLTNLRGQPLDRLRIAIDGCDYRGILERIVGNVSALMKNNCISGDRVLGIGVCLSRSGAGHLDGSGLSEKLQRLKKDLSHALSLPIVTVSTIGGAVSAQCLFGRHSSEQMLLLRYGSQIESAMYLNGGLYRGATDQAGGFPALQQEESGTSYFHALGQEGTGDGTNRELNERLARDIALCRTVMDPERIYCFGSYFETENALREINRILSPGRGAKAVVLPSVITEDTVYLAGCAAVIEKHFYCKNS